MPPALENVVFGLGFSIATQDTRTEIDRDGETSKTLVHSMGDFNSGCRALTGRFSFRLDHRSDAYGVFGADSGSNALAIGFKQRF